jgi:pimeloyl-ACP methyl ester carboxylesterase
LGGAAQRRRILALDWRGHGASEKPTDDFGAAELLDDALAVIEASGARAVVPVTLSHAGWVAIALRERLGARVARLVLLDWIVTEAPPRFLDALAALQDPARWQQTRDGLFAMWSPGRLISAVDDFLRSDMGSYDAAMWARAGREIAAAYAAAGSPLAVLRSLHPPLPVLHMYAQPPDPVYLAAQEAVAAAHRWFQVRRIDGLTHFPMFERPDEMVDVIERFVTAP